MVIAVIIHTEVKAAEIAFAAAFIPTLIIGLVVKSRIGRVRPDRFPERGGG